MSDDLYSINWEQLPLEFERYIPMMLPLLQKPLILTGYGFLQCNWLTFTSVYYQIGLFYILN